MDLLGRQVHVGFAPETTEGTEVAPTRWLGKLEMDFFPRNDSVRNESGWGVLPKDSGVAVVRKYGEGSLTSKLFDKTYGDLLVLLSGQAPTTSAVVGQTGVNDHLYTFLNSTKHKTYTLATKDVDSRRYPGSMVTGGSIEVANDDYVRTSVDFLSQAPTSASDTPAYAEENEFIPDHADLKVVAYGGDLDAASALDDVRSVTVNFGKNPLRKETIGNKTVKPRSGPLECTIEAEIYFNATTFRNYRENNTRLALRLDIENTDVVIGTSAHPRLRIDAPDVRVDDWEPDYGQDDLILQTVTFVVVYDRSTGKWIDATLRNTATAYPTV